MVAAGLMQVLVNEDTAPFMLVFLLPSLSSFSLLLIRQQGDPNPNHIPPSTAEKALSLSAHWHWTKEDCGAKYVQHASTS